jgi:hypothetical protein
VDRPPALRSPSLGGGAALPATGPRARVRTRPSERAWSVLMGVRARLRSSASGFVHHSTGRHCRGVLGGDRAAGRA